MPAPSLPASPQACSLAVSCRLEPRASQLSVSSVRTHLRRLWGPLEGLGNGSYELCRCPPLVAPMATHLTKTKILNICTMAFSPAMAPLRHLPLIRHHCPLTDSTPSTLALRLSFASSRYSAPSVPCPSHLPLPECPVPRSLHGPLPHLF